MQRRRRRVHHTLEASLTSVARERAPGETARTLGSAVRTHTLAAAVVILFGCNAAVSPADGSVDALQADAWDPGPPDVGNDGGLCTTEPVLAACSHSGPGTRCWVPCAFPPTCTFTVQVTWTGSCCFMPDYYEDCVCEDGGARCRLYASPSSERGVPTTRCHCSRDSGPPDSSREDGGTGS